MGCNWAAAHKFGRSGLDPTTAHHRLGWWAAVCSPPNPSLVGWGLDRSPPRDQWAAVSAKRQRQLFDGTPEEYASVKSAYDELVTAYGRLEVEDRMIEWQGDGIQARLEGAPTDEWDRTDYDTKRCVIALIKVPSLIFQRFLYFIMKVSKTATMHFHSFSPILVSDKISFDERPFSQIVKAIMMSLNLAWSIILWE